MPRVLAAAMGPGVGGNKDVRDVQAGGQCYGHSNTGGTGTAYQSFPDGIQNNEAGIAEHRNGNNPAHQFHSQFGVLLTNQLDNHVSQLQSGTGLLQNRADQSAKDDDNTDGRECAGEASTDNIGNAGGVTGLDKGNACNQSQQPFLQDALNGCIL